MNRKEPVAILRELMNRLATVHLIGIDLGSAALKVVELNRSNGKILLRRAAVAAIEEGPSSSFVKKVLNRAGIRTLNAVIGLASPEVVTRSFQFPRMPQKELESAIQIEAEHTVLNGHSFGDVTLDWHTFSDNTPNSIRGLLAVVPRTVIESRLRSIKASGIRPRVVDVEGLALWNAYWALVGIHESSPKTVLLVNIGAQTTNLVIAKGPDELILVRDLQLGGRSLSGGGEEEWLNEVRDSLAYARSKGGLRSLDSVCLTGGGIGPQVEPLLKKIVHAPVTFWNPLDDISLDSQTCSLEKSQGPLLAIAIGLALRQPS